MLFRSFLILKNLIIIYNVHGFGKPKSQTNFKIFVKLLFTTICFVGFYSVPNLIVIIFNLLYPVFIVGFHYKGCERESGVKT